MQFWETLIQAGITKQTLSVQNASKKQIDYLHLIISELKK